jgi:F-type H+-transporting ATPase subunit b
MNLPLNIDWQQILLHLFNFAILSLGLYLLLYKPVKSFMDKRAETIAKQAEDAKSKLDEAEALKLEYEKRLESADKEAADIKAKALEQAQSAADAKLTDAEKQKEKIISDAKAAAQRQKEKVLEESKQEIIELAAQMAEKVLQTKS